MQNENMVTRSPNPKAEFIPSIYAIFGVITVFRIVAVLTRDKISA